MAAPLDLEMNFDIFNSKVEWKVPKETELIICQAYSLLNGMKSGTFTKKDCKKLLVSLGFNVHGEEMKILVEQMTDSEQASSIIEFKAFYAIIKNKMWERKADEEMRQVFQLFDLGRKGALLHETIVRLLSILGEEIGDLQLKEMMDEVDINKTGGITEDDFVKFLRKTVTTIPIC